MFLQFYGMREQPFGVTPDTRFVHFSRTHREALSSLFCGIQDRRGFLALVSPPGTGKTTLLFYLLERLRPSARTVFVYDTPPDPDDLMRYLAADLGIDTGGRTIFGIRQQFQHLMSSERRAGKNVVIVVDEAQNLSQPVLEQLRMLSNFECGTDKLLQIVLAGQPGLATRLTHPDLVQLRQRLSIVAEIKPLSHGEVCAYIKHRLSVAGYNKELFTRDSLSLVAIASKGIPRSINILCYNALALGCAQRRKIIDPDVLCEVTKDLALDVTYPEFENPCNADTDSSSNDDFTSKETSARALGNIAGEITSSRLPVALKASLGIAILLIILPLGVLSRTRTRSVSEASASLISPTLQPSVPLERIVARALRAGEPKANAVSTAKPSGVTDIRYWSQSTFTAVAVETQAQVRYEVHRLASPDRIYVDLYGSRLEPPLIGKRLRVSDPIVKKIRFAQHPGAVTRVTVETYGVCDFRAVAGTKPNTLIIEVQHQARAAQPRPNGASDTFD